MKKRYKIKEDLLDQIKCGTYGPGDKLPSIRCIAEQYHCSITPVVEAYEDLLTTNIIESRPCSGYYVSSDLSSHPELQLHTQLRTLKAEHFETLDSVIAGYSVNSVNAENTISFPFGTTAAHGCFYPIWDISLAIGATFRDKPAGSMNFQTKVHDNVDLKYEIMKWMSLPGTSVSIDELSLVTSVSTALLLAIRACCPSGSSFAVESPGFTGFYFIAQFLGIKTVPVPALPDTGFDVDYFESLLQSGTAPSCVVLSSRFSNPTGAVMPEENKRKLVSLCASRKIPIIEDDILGKICFSENPPLPLKCYDRENVIYISGFGKTLSPEHRVAWLAPGKHADKIAFYKHLIVAYVNPSIQAGFAYYLKNDDAAGSLHHLTSTVRSIMQEQLEIINSCFPLEHPVQMPQGGINLWIPLKKEIDSQILSQHCIADGISITPAITFHSPEGMQNCFRINSLALSWDQDARAHLQRLGKIAFSIYNTICRTNQ